MESLGHRLASYAADIILGVALIWAWFQDLHHVIDVVAPVATPILIGLRIYGAIEEMRVKRLERMHLQLQIRNGEVRRIDDQQKGTAS